MQYAFIGFVIGNDALCLEHWTQIVNFLCNCENYCAANPSEYCQFVTVLKRQLSQFPIDFFYDSISKDSFLRGSLYNLFDNLKDHKDITLTNEGEKLFNMLKKKYKLDVHDIEGLDD